MVEPVTAVRLESESYDGGEGLMLIWGRRWEEPPDYMPLMGLAPTMSRTLIRFTREGLEGRVTGYTEVTIPAQSITAKNSTSLLRKPANKADMVRGKAGFFPFSPGGVEAGSANDRAEELEAAEKAMAEKIGRDGLLQVAPGLSRGLKFEDDEEKDKTEKEVIEEVEGETFEFGDVKPMRVAKSLVVGEGQKKKEGKLSELESIDDLLPVEVSLVRSDGLEGVMLMIGSFQCWLLGESCYRDWLSRRIRNGRIWWTLIRSWRILRSWCRIRHERLVG